jgi:hypothetical protein
MRKKKELRIIIQKFGSFFMKKMLNKIVHFVCKDPKEWCIYIYIYITNSINNKNERRRVK